MDRRATIEALERRRLYDASVTLGAPVLVNISRQPGQQSEGTIAVDPTNPLRLFAASNESGTSLLGATSSDGGLTWATRDFAGGPDLLPQACCDPSAAFDRFDFIVTPTAPSVAFRLGDKVDDPLAMYLNDYCTVPMSLAGIPAVSIPAGLADGLPVGFQIAGPAFSENRILDAAHALEQVIGFDGSEARR